MNADEMDIESQRSHYRKYRDKIIARVKKWRADNPEKVRAYAKKYREMTREQRREQSRQYNRSRPERIHDLHLRREYGITRQDYDRMLAEQNGVCCICGLPESHRTKNRRVDRLSVDHDHTTGKVRGLLCARCNHTIGRVAENSQLLRAIADYIDKHRLHSDC